MASDEEEDSLHELQQGGQKAKKSRLRGACDTCSRRKIKCTLFHPSFDSTLTQVPAGDSALSPGNTCTNCVNNNTLCTHDKARQPKKTEIQQAYIRNLEERLLKMEQLFQALRPDRDVKTLLDLPLSEASASLATLSSSGDTGDSLKSFPGLKYPAPHLSSTLLSNRSSPDTVKQEPAVDAIEEKQDLSHVELSEQLNNLFVEEQRFFGLSSTYMFAHYTMNAKMEASGSSTAYPLDPKMWRRPRYWEMRPWELSFARAQEHPFVYPESDLLNSLVALYFEKSNIITPVLHRPTFLRSLNSGLHLRDSGFGMTVLLVCAIGSRFTSDSRVLLEDDISDSSCGWKYYKQVSSFRNRLFERSTLYDLQCYTLSSLYLLGSSLVHVAWPLVGLGIRFAQDKGLHRRRGKQKHTAEDESAKRVFWALICIDRWMCAFLGRPCAMQDEDFDLDYPIECDDEYWETSDPEKAFKQPPGKPCQVSCFIWAIKLAELLGFALRTLYATKKSKMLIGLIGNEWESQVVAELDSSMNKWKDSLPHFLRWNSENPDAAFLGQSVALHTCFYHLQIQIHRPFLMKRSSLSLTSLAMCTNAARSTAHVLEVGLSRGATLLPASYMSAFAAALVLLLTHWAHQESDSTFDSKTTMLLVRKLFFILKNGEKRWHSAGRFSDLAQILGCLSDQRGNPQLKRRHELDGDRATSQDHQNYHGTLWEQNNFAGGSLQRQIAATKLEPPALRQASCLSTNSWDFNNCLPQMGHSHVQEPFMADQVDNTLTPCITQNADTVPFLANSRTSLSSHETQAPNLFDPHLQVRSSTEDPASSMDLNLSDNLVAMWANVPISFSPYEWNTFLSNAMQLDAQSKR